MAVLCYVLIFLLSLTGAGAAFAASPDPQATVEPTTLPVIGRTRSKRYCALEADRTNGAVTVALLNDKIISAGIGRLRSADLDKPELTIIEREKTMRDLRSVAAAIQSNTRVGATQVADLRTLSVREPDAGRSQELKLLADRFDKTLDRQQSVGTDLAKMLTIIDGRFARSQGALLAASVMPETAQDHVQNGIASIDQRAAYEPLDALFNEVADDFSARTLDIGKFEDDAAVHVPKATQGC